MPDITTSRVPTPPSNDKDITPILEKAPLPTGSLESSRTSFHTVESTSLTVLGDVQSLSVIRLFMAHIG